MREKVLITEGFTNVEKTKAKTLALIRNGERASKIAV